MDLNRAQSIIEQQARFIIVKNRKLTFDIYDGDVLESLFWDNQSRIVTKCAQFGGEDKGKNYYFVFKIDHPEHGIGYYKVIGTFSSWDPLIWDGGAVMVTPITTQITEWEHI